MRGFSEMVKSCWKIQKDFNLTDQQMSELLGIVKNKYEKRQREREHIADLITKTAQTIKDNRGDTE